MRILLVDDSLISINKARSILANSDLRCEILTSTSGEQALAIMETEPVDVVLLDIVMPEPDGLEVLSRIRSQPRFRDVQVLMLTGLKDRESIVQSFNLGAADYIEKPIDELVFLARIRSALRSRQEILARNQTLTALLKTEEQLQRNQEQHEAILDHTHDAVFLVAVTDDGTFHYEKLSRAHELLTGAPNERVIGKTPWEVFNNEDAAAVTANYRRCVVSKAPLEYEEIRDLPNGRYTWLTKLVPILEGNRVVQILGSSRNITRHKLTEERLRLLNECFLALGPDPRINIRRIVETTGRLLAGNCAMYNRLSGTLLTTEAGWQTPPDMPNQSPAQGHICHDLIQRGGEVPFVVLDLPTSIYAESDPAVRRYGLQTYVAYPVKVSGHTTGTLCVVFMEHREFDPEELQMLQILGQALQVEEERLKTLKALRKSEEHYRAMVESIDAMLYICSQDYRVEYMNERMTTYIGRDATGDFCYYALYGRDEVCPWCVNDRVLHGEKVRNEIQNPRDKRWFSIFHTPIQQPNGRVAKLAVYLDITYRKQMEEALRTSEDALRVVFNSVYDAIFIHETDGTIIDVNDTMLAMYRVNRKQALNLSILTDYSSPENPLNLIPHLWKKVVAGENQLFEWLARRPNDGSVFNVEVFLTKITLDGREVILANVRDITERKRMEEQLRYMSMHDSLTGLYNRAYFEKEMHRLDSGREDPVSLVICDVDGLKLVNDSLGHDGGDTLLKVAAHVIQDAFRTTDVVARVGGDEFAILLPQTDNATVQEAIRRICAGIAGYNATKPEIPLSISIGYATRDNNDISLLEIFKEADNDMYREKLHRGESARSAIVQTLMKALEERDMITEGHADRLQHLVTALGTVMGLPERRMTDLRLLAQFHDIGKVGIPDRILFKPGPLTPEEFGEMQRHCEIGHRIAQSAPDLLLIADWILKHHEWWNGNGYPLGLQGEDIPLECRILAIADAFDAMTSNRPYRQAMSREEAVAELQRCAGSQFDPELVQKFIMMITCNQGA